MAKKYLSMDGNQAAALVSVPREELDSLLADFEAVGMETKVSVVGCVKERQEKLIQLKKGKMEML